MKNDSFFYRAELYFKRLFWRFTNKKRQYLRVGKCLQCGRCCRDIGILLDGLKISSMEEFKALVKEEPDYGIFVESGESYDGSLIFSCSKISSDNKCTIYKSRPEICRDYPDLHLMRMGTELHEQCGFKLFPPFDFEEIYNDVLRRK